MLKRTEISITIDTECSIAGAFGDPEAYKPVAEPAIMCAIDGREHGLGFLLDTFSKYSIKASFFVECAQYYYFGEEPMKTVMKRILQAGQDAQLHIHPCWLNFNEDPAVGTFPKNDSCAGREYQDLKRIFELSVDVFKKLSGKRPDAIRTGSLVADQNIYQVMKDLDIPLSSNIAIGVDEPKDQSLHLMGGRKTINGVMELPVLSYQDTNFLGKKNIKSLQITSCSWPEMKYILKKARKLGVENIVILTHPFEFVKKDGFQYKNLVRNRVNQERLEKLCRFISQNDQDFISADFGSKRDDWLARGDITQDLFSVPNRYMIGRKIHNKLNDTVWAY